MTEVEVKSDIDTSPRQDQSPSHPHPLPVILAESSCPRQSRAMTLPPSSSQSQLPPTKSGNDPPAVILDFPVAPDEVRQ